MPEAPCPACGLALVTRTAGGRRVAYCTACRGMWFAAGTLQRMLAGVRPRARTAPPPFGEDGIGGSGTTKATCPTDAEPLHRAIWGDAVFARCGTCRGLWIGAEALRVIVEEVRGERVDPRVPDPEDSVLMILLGYL